MPYPKVMFRDKVYYKAPVPGVPSHVGAFLLIQPEYLDQKTKEPRRGLMADYFAGKVPEDAFYSVAFGKIIDRGDIIGEEAKDLTPILAKEEEAA